MATRLAFSWTHPRYPRYLHRSFATTTNLCTATQLKKIEAFENKPPPSETKKDDPLPPLNRPLGVKQRPTTVERTRTEKLKDLLDQEARMAQRRHLCV